MSMSRRSKSFQNLNVEMTNGNQQAPADLAVGLVIGCFFNERDAVRSRHRSSTMLDLPVNFM